MALLEAVELYGFGNWEDTAAFIGKKDPHEVRDYFVLNYIDGVIGKAAWSQVEDTYTVTDTTCPADGPLSPSLTKPLTDIPELTMAEQQHLGYMPKRDDFERELDNDAEALISTLSINPNDDDEVDTDLKLAHIDMYRRRLEERFRLKEIARDYGLVKQFYKTLIADEEFMSTVTLVPSLVPVPVVDEDTNQSTASVSSKTPKKIKTEPGTEAEKPEKEKKDPLVEKFKIFSQFQKASEQREMFDRMRREKELKARISELMRYRRNGLKKQSEIPAFESARLRRDKKKENKKKVSV